MLHAQWNRSLPINKLCLNNDVCDKFRNQSPHLQLHDTHFQWIASNCSENRRVHAVWRAFNWLALVEGRMIYRRILFPNMHTQSSMQWALHFSFIQRKIESMFDARPICGDEWLWSKSEWDSCVCWRFQRKNEHEYSFIYDVKYQVCAHSSNSIAIYVLFLIQFAGIFLVHLVNH